MEKTCKRSRCLFHVFNDVRIPQKEYKTVQNLLKLVLIFLCIALSVHCSAIIRCCYVPLNDLC